MQQDTQVMQLMLTEQLCISLSQLKVDNIPISVVHLELYLRSKVAVKLKKSTFQKLYTCMQAIMHIVCCTKKIPESGIFDPHKLAFVSLRGGLFLFSDLP